MAFGSKVQLEIKVGALEAENNLLKSRIEELEKDRNDLNRRLSSTQDALVAAASPAAYADQKAEEFESSLTEEDKEKMKLRNLQSEANRTLLESMEQPLFKDADDMIDMFTRAVGPPESSSLHDNEES